MNIKFLLAALSVMTAVMYTFSGDKFTFEGVENARIACRDADSYTDKYCEIKIKDLIVRRYFDKTIAVYEIDRHLNLSNVKTKTKFESVYNASDDKQSSCWEIRWDGDKKLPLSACQDLRTYLPVFNKVFDSLGDDPSNWVDVFRFTEDDKKRSFTEVIKKGEDPHENLTYKIAHSKHWWGKIPKETCKRGIGDAMDKELPSDKCVSLHRYATFLDTLDQDIEKIKSRYKVNT